MTATDVAVLSQGRISSVHTMHLLCKEQLHLHRLSMITWEFFLEVSTSYWKTGCTVSYLFFLSYECLQEEHFVSLLRCLLNQHCLFKQFTMQ